MLEICVIKGVIGLTGLRNTSLVTILSHNDVFTYRIV